ncbi:MAG: asparagine synthase-related protein [Chloroflexota bacterium]
MNETATANAAQPVDWFTFGTDQPAGWRVDYDSESLKLTGSSAYDSLSVAETDRWTVILDGRLHNNDALAGYIQSGNDTLPISDAELVGRAFDVIGTDIFAEIHGVFSVIIWDRTTDKLLAARDPLGIWPLFYYRKHNSLHLSTSLTLLKDIAEPPTSLNRPVLAIWVSNVWMSHDETPFEGIRRIPSQYYFVAERGDIALTRYWQPTSKDGKIDWLVSGNPAEFQKLLWEAVDGLSAHEGPNAIFLSGGLDSVSVAMIATDIARERGEPLPLALSVRMPGEDADESAVQTHGEEAWPPTTHHSLTTTNRT